MIIRKCYAEAKPKLNRNAGGQASTDASFYSEIIHIETLSFPSKDCTSKEGGYKTSELCQVETLTRFTNQYETLENYILYNLRIRKKAQCKERKARKLNYF